MPELLGREYPDGAVIIRQGEKGSCMYVIQLGRVEVVQRAGGAEHRLAVLGEGEVFGEMAIFEREVRSATVRALGDCRILTVDRRAFLRRVQEDPSLAFHILGSLSQRIRRLDAELSARRDDLAPGDERETAV